MHELLIELKQRWQGMFSALAAGDDLPPTLRLRTEGMMEAAVLTGAATAAELQDLLCESYRASFGHSVAEAFGPQWQELFPFPQIPAMARRAPVYPSTRD